MWTTYDDGEQFYRIMGVYVYSCRLSVLQVSMSNNGIKQ